MPLQAAVIVTVPVFLGVTLPLEFTEAILLLEDFQRIEPAGVAVAFKVTGLCR